MAASKNKSNNDVKVEVRKSSINGKGIYATANIPKESIIFVVEGTIHEFHAADDSWSIPHSISYAKNKWINPNPDNPLRYTNHSCNPNAIIGEGLKVIALRNIRIGDEVTIDYSLTEDDPKSTMGKCNCASINCRKIIEPIHYLPARIIEANRKYLRKWIVDSYYNNKNKLNLKKTSSNSGDE